MALRCCEFHAGRLKEPVTFERRTLTSDGAGGQTETWAKITGSPSYAAVLPVSGSERYASDRTEAIVRLRLVVRYTSDLLESDRVKIRGKVHNIRYLDNIEFADKWLQIDVDGGVAA
jgi:SPP1 family predicted phage head-tail adaptor